MSTENNWYIIVIVLKIGKIENKKLFMVTLSIKKEPIVNLGYSIFEQSRSTIHRNRSTVYW